MARLEVMLALLILMPDRRDDAERLREYLRRLDGDLDIRVWPDAGQVEAVETVVAWKQPAGELARFPNLRAVISYGAGVEHLVSDPSVPEGVFLARTVDDQLVRDMVEFVVGRIIAHRRHFREYEQDRRNGRWRPRAYGDAFSVVVMGAGRLGGAVARTLAGLGYHASAWSRSGQAPPGVAGISGDQALADSVTRADSVVCLLPLTSATEGLINRRFLAGMKPGALLMNVGRGAHVVEDDLLQALREGRPGHAVLDVFEAEPLPSDHPFWRHPQITVSPHIASLTNPESVARRILENHHRAVAGSGLVDQVDPARGY